MKLLYDLLATYTAIDDHFEVTGYLPDLTQAHIHKLEKHGRLSVKEKWKKCVKWSFEKHERLKHFQRWHDICMAQERGTNMENLSEGLERLYKLKLLTELQTEHF